MRVICCGGRDYTDVVAVYKVLDALDADRPITTLVHGGCHGVDEIAALWAREPVRRGRITLEPHGADWRQHGPSAGPKRNTHMARLGADLCVVFPGGRGTADMHAKAKAAGIPVHVVA